MTDSDQSGPGAAIAPRPGELTRTIALVGMMGAGKTTIGRKLASALGATFVDSDREIEKAADMSVQEIFETLGEKEFRRGERAVIKRLLKGDPIVLATGGGAYLESSTRNLMKTHAITVWMNADIDVLWRRVSRRSTRPLLQQPNPREVLERLNEERSPVYAEADFVVESGDGPADEVVSALRKALGV